MTDAMPPDVYPESGFRLPPPDRATMDAAAQRLYDYFADPNSGSYAGLWGPGGIRLHSPKLALTMQAHNDYLRREAGIDRQVRELCILATARELDSQFEWTAHEPEALKEGISPATIDIVRHRRPVDGLSETEQVVILLGREIFGARKVTKQTFARALALFGARKLVDLVAVMGNYANTAALLTAFDMQLRPGRQPLLPVG
jgi:4-carboxymuconolactone decarboxylase